MRWPWSREPQVARRDDPSSASGTEARERAEIDLAESQARWPEVNTVARSLRELRERNHFADQLEFIFRGSQP